MKENDGKAARRKLTRQLVIIVTIFLIIIGGVTIFSRTSSSSTSSGNTFDMDAHNRLLQHGASAILNKDQEYELLKRVQKRKEAMKEKERRNEGRQFNKIPKEVILEKILNAELHLVDLDVVEEEVRTMSPNTYDGIYGIFCELDFSIHKNDPSKVPMFRDLVNSSDECQLNKYRFNLKEIVTLAKQRDIEIINDPIKTVPKVLELSTVVFHESRCGSTLVANTLIGMNPIKHRTYSESTPPAIAIKSICGETYSICTKQQAALALKDTMYIMSRTNDPKETNVFFKMQSITTRNIEVFQLAYPTVPWLFIYRDPVQVMMSHIKDGLHHANCVRSKISPPTIVKKLISDVGITKHPTQIDDEYYCAAHLSSIVESAVAGLERSINNNGYPILYDTLPEILYENILPKYILKRDITSNEINNIQDVSSKYAKGRGNRARTFEGDSEQKEQAASNKVKHAAELFLQNSYQTLQSISSSL